MEIDLRLQNIFKDLQEVPSVPFLTSLQQNHITSFLDKHNIKYKTNKFSVIVYPNQLRDNLPKLVIMGHADHPGIILKNSREGVLMGLIGGKNFSKFLEAQKVPIRIYNPQGEFLGKGNIIKMTGGPKQEVVIDTNIEVPINSFGQFDVDYFKENSDSLEVYNADDGIAIATMLRLLEDPENLKFNTYFVFNLYEEVHQLSAWYLAKNNILNITKDDYVLNLECLKTESISDEKYGVIDYSKGIVLQLSNTGCLFGYKNPGPNICEKLIRKVALDNNIDIQLGIIKDSCDSRPFTEFALTSNICTLTVPNKYKHDGADDGMLRSELILKKHISDFYLLLKHILSSNLENTKVFDSIDSLSLQLKQHAEVTDLGLMTYKRILNERLEIAFTPVISRQYFFPQSLNDKFMDFSYKIISYIKYFYLKTISR